MSRPRHVARSFGIEAEALAALWLRLKFYRILARNYRAPGGEIDLVAMRGETVAFIEVKARPDGEAALTAVSATKSARISAAARHWLARNGWAMGKTLRGDLVAIAPGRLPQHIEAALALDLGHA
jgi:putative endonuclease